MSEMSSEEMYLIDANQKQKLSETLSELIRSNSELRQTISTLEEGYRGQSDQLYLELVELLDSVESIILTISNCSEPNPRLWKRLPKNLTAFRDRLLLILSRRSVSPIEYECNTVNFDLCNVVETEQSSELADGTILEILKTGYYVEDRILRPLDVVTVKNL